MGRWMMMLCLACAFVVLAGCASRRQVTDLNATVVKLGTRVDAADKQGVERNARIEALEKQGADLAARLDTLEKQAGSLDARLATVEKLSAELDARIKNSEKLSAEAGKQAQAVSTELDMLKNDVKQVAGVATKSHELFIKSMENLRELYKRQYDALDEMINRTTPAPAPATPK